MGFSKIKNYMTKKDLLEAIEDMPMDAEIKYKQETILIPPYNREATKVTCYKGANAIVIS